MVIVIMGVSGSGKTTIAAQLAERLRSQLAEADTFHSGANVEKMRSGVALTDEDRWPWLGAIAEWIDAARASGRPSVVACSALKRCYRDIIVGNREDVRLVYLKGDYDRIVERMAARVHHYMPVSLLRSQFDTLEEPGADEDAIVVDIASSPEEIVAAIVSALKLDEVAATPRGESP